MKDMLERLRAANPELKLYSVTEESFSRYGRVLSDEEIKGLTDALSTTEIPESGNRYVASSPELEREPAAKRLARSVFGGMDTQTGYCNGHGYRLNALEYHKCSEVDLSSTGAVLLLARAEDIAGGELDSSKAEAFWLPPGVPVELYPMTLHFAPCRVDSFGFTCMVMLERGVNSPVEREDGEDGKDGKDMLFARGKWLIAHPESPSAKAGAYIGIRGENTEIASADG